jgi:hypothetical protein
MNPDRKCNTYNHAGHCNQNCPITLLEEKMTKMMSMLKLPASTNLITGASSDSDIKLDPNESGLKDLLKSVDAYVIESIHKLSDSGSILFLDSTSSPWILDFKATTHVTGSRFLLDDLSPSQTISNVCAASSHIHAVVGLGHTSL